MLIKSILELLSENLKIDIICKMSTKWIEKNINELPIRFIDIFYQKKWSLEFLECILEPTDVEMWDYISIFYTLTQKFCENNIDWLNFHDLVHCQNLPTKFYIKHISRIDWIKDINEDNILEKIAEY